MKNTEQRLVLSGLLAPLAAQPGTGVATPAGIATAGIGSTPHLDPDRDGGRGGIGGGV